MKIIYLAEEEYPIQFKNIKNKPKKIFVEGNIQLLNKPSIAIVGSRNHSEYGKEMTKKFTKDLVKEGFAIVSGMAIGIDSFAHDTCIMSGGKTIAVMATGFKHIYPKENIHLYKKILDSGGCVITEYEPEKEVNKNNFRARNRLISGLSIATLVIEAKYRSGTSITASYCIKQNKKLFCLPNAINSKNSTGTNNLIKKGAHLVTCVEDITKEIGRVENKVEIEKNKLKESYVEIPDTFSNVDIKIYNLIKLNPKTKDEIANKIKLNISQVNSSISILEMEGYILKMPDNKYMVKNNE